MTRFSDRLGITRPPVLVQNDMPASVRVALWNVFQPLLFIGGPSGLNWTAPMNRVYRYLRWKSHEMTASDNVEISKLTRWFCDPTLAWYEVYNFLEFVAQLLAKMGFAGEIFEEFNGVLEEEGSPYRFVGDTLTQITDPLEVHAVEEALAVGDRFGGPRKHLSTALGFFGLRPEPDYPNAITEAVSAVESTLKILTGSAHATLAEALKDFVRTRPIHGALFKGLDSLYGYTSNEHGLRHALLEKDAKAGFAEAKFMIVACAAFVSFLIAKAATDSSH